ncbi:MAG: hypothetical protein R3E12_00560 [Candidatus Eisenbacteria bacterium]
MARCGDGQNEQTDVVEEGGRVGILPHPVLQPREEAHDVGGEETVLLEQRDRELSGRRRRRSQIAEYLQRQDQRPDRIRPRVVDRMTDTGRVLGEPEEGGVGDLEDLGAHSGIALQYVGDGIGGKVGGEAPG